MYSLRSLAVFLAFLLVWLGETGLAADNAECVEDTDPAGLKYSGTQSTTSTGRTCQNWAVDTPHKPSYRPSEPTDHKNYCRNPDSDVKGPWCYTTDSNKRWEYCNIPSCSGFAECVQDTNLPGLGYTGTQSRTTSGTTCQRWDVNKPHQTNFRPTDPGKHKNYCRNPDRDPKGTWCYTTDKSKRWEYCSIPKCSGTCGIQMATPRFLTQSFGIRDGRLLPVGVGQRVLGGDGAVHGSWPWSADLQYSNSHFCGGTLIKHNLVLTAAHCVVGRRTSQLSVKVGHFKGSEPQMQEKKLLRYIVHPSYSAANSWKNDIAVIVTETPFLLNNYVSTACLPDPGYIVPGNSYCVVTGWGKTYDPSYEKELKQAVLPVHSHSDCMKYMGRAMADQTQMCAGKKGLGHDTCKGDSGGPLVCLMNNKWSVQGITSWGGSCSNKKGHYGSYTRVSKYIDWITQQISTYS